MNLLKRIKIENIKGKQNLEVKFTDLTANQPNIIVAPNGFGKSTLATAFKAASNGRLKLDVKDIYQQDPSNHPKLEIELQGEMEGTYISSDTDGEISRNISVYTICSSLYAKSTTRHFNKNVTPTADLRVEQVIIFDKKAKNCALDYSYRSSTQRYGEKAKLFLNISEMLTVYKNIHELTEIQDCIKKCCTQKKIQNGFSQFLDGCPSEGTAESIKREISQELICRLRDNENVVSLFDCIAGFEKKPSTWKEIDIAFTAIQLCDILKCHFDKGENNILKNVEAFLEYKEVKDLVDKRLDQFNTTGRRVRAREDHDKLVIDFERAAAMSNGERDILSFIANLTKFEFSFRKKVGILIIDEVFDYLDGSNLLAVQYYLSELISQCKSQGKVLYPIIFTHLDPEVFSNYYFKKRKVHYISLCAPISLNTKIVRLLRLRENVDITNSAKEEIEKYYIHYVDERHSPSEELAAYFSDELLEDNISFRNCLYEEVEKYLSENEYDPIKIIAGIRIRIEELVYQKLDSHSKDEFVQQHKVINKLQFAEKNGIEVPEVYYLLQPLYNDGLHLGGRDQDVKRKIESCYLKTNNMHIKKMIKELFA